MTRLLLALLLAGPAIAGVKGDIRDGDKAMEAGKYQQAVRSYERALAASPEDGEILLRLARADLALGDPEAALAPARVARAGGVEGADTVLARALLETGAAAEAAAIAGQVPGHESDPELLEVLGEAELSLRHFERAAEHLEQAAAAGRVRAHIAWAYALVRAGRIEEARLQANTLQLRHSSDTFVLAGVTIVHNLSGDLAAAKAASEQAQLAAGQLVGGRSIGQKWLDQANARHERGDIEGALWLGLPAQALAPFDGHLSWVLGVWWLQAGEYTFGAAFLSLALELPPYALSQEQAVQVAVPSAVDRSQRLAARVQIALSLARCYEKLEDPVAEATALEIAVESTEEPGVETLLRLSKAYEAAGRYPDSARTAVAAAEADPTHVEASFRVAQGYAAAGRVEVAIAYAMRAWNGATGDPEIALLLSDLYVQRREVRMALEVLSIAIEANPRRQDLVESYDQIARQAAFPY